MSCSNNFALGFVIGLKEHLIMTLLQERLDIGRERYGQGVRMDDDYNWETMMMEEALDGMIYAATQLLRLKKKRDNKLYQVQHTRPSSTSPH